MGSPITRKVLVSLATCAVALAACSAAPGTSAPGTTGPAGGATATAAAGANDKITFLTDFSLYGYAAPFFAGGDQGFFRDEGIDLTVLPGKGSADTAAQVGAGSAQFGLADPINVLMAIDKNVPNVMVASHWQSHLGGFCYVTPTHDLNELADFADLRFGGVAGDSYYAILQKLMEQAGIDTSKMVFETMTGANATAALLAGQIDSHSCGIATFPSRAVSAKQSGVDLGFFSLAKNGLDAVGHAIVTNPSLVASDADLVERFVRAYARSVVWSTLNVDAAVAAYIKANPDQDTAGAKAALEAVAEYAVDEAAAANKGQFSFPTAKTDKTIEQVNTWFTLKVDASKAYTNQFIDKLDPALLQGKLP